MIKFKDGFVINADTYWRSSYRISPYNTSYNSINKKILDGKIINKELIQSFFGNNFIPAINGRAAISLALSTYSLTPDDEIWIVTTSGNKYISSCVTKEIEKVCKWTMKMTDKVKLIFVNHEFGYCYERLEQLKAYHLPVIEDKALSFASMDSENLTGTIGDFVVYSLPKFFPIPFGGVLKSNVSLRDSTRITDATLQNYFEILMTHYLPLLPGIAKKRHENYKYIASLFEQFGFSPYFSYSEKNIPGVFLFNTRNLNLQSYKDFMLENGIESSVFYGKDAYYLPVHHNLKKEDLDFFYYLTSEFIENGNK